MTAREKAEQPGGGGWDNLPMAQIQYTDENGHRWMTNVDLDDPTEENLKHVLKEERGWSQERIDSMEVVYLGTEGGWAKKCEQEDEESWDDEE